MYLMKHLLGIKKELLSSFIQLLIIFLVEVGAED